MGLGGWWVARGLRVSNRGKVAAGGEGVGHRRRAGQVGQRMKQDSGPEVKVGDRNMLVDVVTGIRLSRKPHAKGDRAWESLGVSAPARNRRSFRASHRLPVVLE